MSVGVELVQESHQVNEQSKSANLTTKQNAANDKVSAMVFDAAEGLFNYRAFVFLILWYIFSALTLFMNKHIVDSMHGEPTLVGVVMMIVTMFCGFVQLYFPCGMFKPSKSKGIATHFYRNMILVGSCRFITIVLGLITLKYVAVSFAETIKSSAPMFTVFIAKLLMGEDTSLLVALSLVPIMAGLALTSAYELSFNIQGFLAALATNITECLQNVYSKKLISGSETKYTPAEMQFYSSACSLGVQIPVCLFLMDFEHAHKSMSSAMIISLILNGVFFHCQTISEYCLMSYISPVTHSVANTVKRAFLIWVSVLIFGNPVSFLSGVGMVVVTSGVLLYNKAREREAATKQALLNYSITKELAA